MLLRCLYEISLSFPRFLTFSPCIILLCICVITHADPCSFACRSECSHHHYSASTMSEHSTRAAVTVTVINAVLVADCCALRPP
ncbi:hypothetical protein EDD17DRAFT_432695 [Pisolithus thermaeus]|nr:hypothetical protein EDD17DRAFT_432695 [Pisolithus thermaeus]